jgi:hypothetical protein
MKQMMMISCAPFEHWVGVSFVPAPAGALKRLFYWCTTRTKMEYNVTAENISQALKVAVAALNYHSQKGIPIDCVNTHLLQCGGANALALSRFTDTQIQKMGQWKGETLKEYKWDELKCFFTGMFLAMKTHFGFLNVAGTAFHEVTDLVIKAEYNRTITVHQ